MRKNQLPNGQKTVKKTKITTKQRVAYWVIPPKSNGEFAAAMENIIATYEKAYDPEYPVVCMDEQPVQLLDDVYEPIPATLHHGKRVDYEYKRCGTSSIFMFIEPLTGWRYVHAREHRTKRDWSEEVHHLLDFYPQAKRVILVCDNLNTHSYGSFYERYPPSAAFELCHRLELRHTPIHGSWLNVAESELSVLTRQCLSHRRFATVELLNLALWSWNAERNARSRQVDWQFTTDDARTKLKSIYPQI